MQTLENALIDSQGRESMKLKKIFFYFLKASILTSCVHQDIVSDSQQNKEVVGQKKQMMSLRAKEDQLQEKKDQQKVKESLARLQKKEDSQQEVQIYTEIVANYRAKESDKLTVNLKTFLRKFPYSPYADNAIYLSADLALNRQDYSAAIALYNQIIFSYPQGLKVAGALYAKAVTFQRMNLEAEAMRVFAKVIEKYPQSSEARLAQKVLESAPQQMTSENRTENKSQEDSQIENSMGEDLEGAVRE